MSKKADILFDEAKQNENYFNIAVVLVLLKENKEHTKVIKVEKRFKIKNSHFLSHVLDKIPNLGF